MAVWFKILYFALQIRFGDMEEILHAWRLPQHLKQPLYILSFFFFLMGVPVEASGNTKSLEDSIASSVQLDEVQIKALSDKSIINTAIGHLPKRYKVSDLVSVYGTGQHIQLIECNGKIVQLSRLYGYYTASSGSVKYVNRAFQNWDMSFNAVYNARSLRYNATGTSVLEKNCFQLGGRFDNPKNRFVTYDARRTYVFDVMEAMYFFAPILSRHYSDYIFEYSGMTDGCYRYSFESSSRYPKKNLLYAKGYVLIDVGSCSLRSIHVDNMGLNYVDLYGMDWDVSPEDDRIKHDCEDCDFEFDEMGEIVYAKIHVQWNPDILQYFTPPTGGMSQPRPDASNNNCIVTECWKAESCHRSNRRNGMLGFFMEIVKEKFESRDSIYLVTMLDQINQGNDVVDSWFHGEGEDPKYKIGVYNPTAIDKIQWAMDVSDAERQLGLLLPIEEQYRLQSSDFLNSSDETRYREHKNEFDDPEVSRAEKRLYFDDPIGSPALGLNFDISDFKKMGKENVARLLYDYWGGED